MTATKLTPKADTAVESPILLQWMCPECEWTLPALQHSELLTVRLAQYLHDVEMGKHGSVRKVLLDTGSAQR